MMDAIISTESTPTAIWSPLPKQPKQTRCRRNLAHSETRRTFYWIAEQSGPICQACVNVRNTRIALAEQEAGNSGNEATAGKSGNKGTKKGRSTTPPSVKNAVVALRREGMRITHISKKMKISKPTVYKVLRETNVDAETENYREEAKGLIPPALKAVKHQLEAKMDGNLGRAILNDMAVIGEKAQGGGQPAIPAALMQQINVLYNPPPSTAQPAITIEPAAGVANESSD